MGLGVGRDGAFAEYVALPMTNVWHHRPGIDEETPVFGPKEEAWLDALERLGWRDAFRLVRGRARAYTWYSPNRGNGFRIDQAFVNHELQPRLRGVRYDWGRRARPRAATPSDHAALLLDLRG